MKQTQRQQAKALWIKRYRAYQKIGRLITKLDVAWKDYQNVNMASTANKRKSVRI